MRIIRLLAVPLLLVGCSSLSVNTDHSPTADFSAIETFQYVDSDANLAESSPLDHQRIVAELKSHMEASGLTEVESGADVGVTYYGSIDQQVQFVTTYSTVGGWGRWGRASMGVSSARTTPVTYTSGTLVIDIFDVEANELIWRGQVSDSLTSNHERNIGRLRRGIAAAFDDFPPS